MAWEAALYVGLKIFAVVLLTAAIARLYNDGTHVYDGRKTMMIVCKYHWRQFRFWLARNIVRFGWMICPQPEKMLMQYIWDEGVKSTEERNQCKPH